MKYDYDLIVIGSGPGGYEAAIRSSQLGMKTAIIEKSKVLGGTCLNVGCIPTKALLETSEIFHQAKHRFEQHGITGNVQLDIKKMIERKNKVVKETTDGVRFLMKKNKIDVHYATASFESNNEISLDGKDKISGSKILIATGSEVAELPNIPIDEKRILSSTGMLDLEKIPKHLVVIGGGVIGMEIGSVFSRIGSKVTVIDVTARPIASMDEELGKTLEKILKKEGFVFECESSVEKVKYKEGTEGIIEIIYRKKNGDKKTVEADYVLSSVGRRPYTKGLNLEKIGIKLDNKGRIEKDKNFETNIKGVYAIGDVVDGIMLAHKASEEAIVCVEKMMGKASHINYGIIPSVVYTWPEVASVGKMEEELKENNINYKKGKFPFKASGRARVSGDTDGFVKILSDSDTDEIFGIHMIGPRCADMIAEAVLAMEFKASSEDIGMTIHAHPTFSEAIKEAALDVNNEAINI